MQVWELIRELRKFDGKLMVVVDGYEDGVDNPEEPREIEIFPHREDPMFGKYGIADEWDKRDNPHRPITKAVYIGR